MRTMVRQSDWLDPKQLRNMGGYRRTNLDILQGLASRLSGTVYKAKLPARATNRRWTIMRHAVIRKDQRGRVALFGSRDEW